MPYKSEFRALPGGEDLITLTKSVVAKVTTDQRTSYKLVKAVKVGSLPKEMQEIRCGPLCHARWLNTVQRLVFMWTRKHGLTGQDLRTLEVLVQVYITFYFKLYFHMMVKHFIADAPYHILTSLQLL